MGLQTRPNNAFSNFLSLSPIFPEIIPRFSREPTAPKMKKSGLLAASVAAASATAVSASSFAQVSVQDGGVQRSHGGSSPAASSSSSEKFAPRFDGLRFIETLITAHR